MSRSRNSLKLSRETLRNLQPGALANVVGGGLLARARMDVQRCQGPFDRPCRRQSIHECDQPFDMLAPVKPGGMEGVPGIVPQDSMPC